MAIEITKATRVEVQSFKDALGGGMSIQQFEQDLAGLDLNDPTAVATAARRCNKRCNGNDIDVMAEVTPGGLQPYTAVARSAAAKPRAMDVESRRLRLSFRISEGQQADVA